MRHGRHSAGLTDVLRNLLKVWPRTPQFLRNHLLPLLEEKGIQSAKRLVEDRLSDLENNVSMFSTCRKEKEMLELAAAASKVEISDVWRLCGKEFKYYKLKDFIQAALEDENLFRPVGQSRYGFVAESDATREAFRRAH